MVPPEHKSVKRGCLVMEGQESVKQRIKEIIYDEEKMVTTMSLMDDLHIAGETAGPILDDFYKEGKKSDLKFYSTHVVTGCLKEGNAFAVYLTKDDVLQKTKSLFSGKMTETVYSLQKGEQIDFTIISTLNTNLRNNKPPLTSKNSTRRRKIKSEPTGGQSSTKNPVQIKENVENKAEKVQPTQQKTKQKGGIANFFTQKASKSGINENVTKKEANKSTEIKTELKPAIEENSSVEVSMEVKVELEEPRKKTKTPPVQEQRNSKKRKNNSINSKSNKKHKRIIQIEDSDDSDMFEDSENVEDIVEQSDEEIKPVQISKPPLPPKNKKRKAVDKTYVNDEGFMVTSTEYVYESASEEEEVNHVQEKKKTPSPVVTKKLSEKNGVPPKNAKGKQKKGAPPAKQQTLMNFFKRA